jgi:hypothetical protein
VGNKILYVNLTINFNNKIFIFNIKNK